MTRKPVSRQDAADLLAKLVGEHLPVNALLISARTSHASIEGFVDSATAANGIVVSPVPLPSLTLLRFELTPDCEFFFGDKREIPEDRREELSAKYGEAALRNL